MLNFNHFLDCITHPNNTVAAEDEYDDACELILSNLIPAKQGNCWLSKDSAPSEPFSIVGTPSGETITVHRLLYTETIIWTVSIDVWNVGGGA